jgi:hypothetical protein
MTIGWGEGGWGEFAWGGEDGEAFTPACNFDLTLTPTIPREKRVRTIAFDPGISLLPTSDFARGLKSNLSLSLVPSSGDVVTTTELEETNFLLTLLPESSLTLQLSDFDVSLSITPEITNARKPDFSVDLTIENEEYLTKR